MLHHSGPELQESKYVHDAATFRAPWLQLTKKNISQDSGRYWNKKSQISIQQNRKAYLKI